MPTRYNERMRIARKRFQRRRNGRSNEQPIGNSLNTGLANAQVSIQAQTSRGLLIGDDEHVGQLQTRYLYSLSLDSESDESSQSFRKLGDVSTGELTCPSLTSAATDNSTAPDIVVIPPDSEPQASSPSIDYAQLLDRFSGYVELSNTIPDADIPQILSGNAASPNTLLHDAPELSRRPSHTSFHSVTGIITPGSDEGEQGHHATVSYEPDPELVLQSLVLFMRSLKDLHTLLGRFLDQCRRLGRSYTLILSALDLRKELKCLSSVFHHNATQISRLVKRYDFRAHVEYVESPDRVSDSSLVESLERAASVFERVMGCLNNFREYTDESTRLKDRLRAIGKHLRYCARCLKAYEDHLDMPHIAYYVHELSTEIRKDIDEINSALSEFNEYGITAIRYEQRRDADVTLNMSTVATLFSAVNATMLQISLGYDPSRIMSIVNAFWFCSLVLSIGCALNCVLALAWKRTTYGGFYPDKFPFAITIWIHASAPAFLALSIVCFSLGLIVFTHASSQTMYTVWLTFGVIVITSLGLAILQARIFYEKWIIPIVATSIPSGHQNDATNINPVRAIQKRMPQQRRFSSTFSEASEADSVAEVSTDEKQGHPQGVIMPVLRSLTGTKAPQPQQSPPPDEATDVVATADVENQLQVPDMALSQESQEAAKNRWKKAADLLSVTTSVTKAFWRGTARNTPRFTSLSSPETTTRQRELNRTSTPLVDMVFPEKRRQVVPHRYGRIQDLEYSPDGKMLAVTCYNAEIAYSTTSTFLDASYEGIYRRRHPPRKVSKQVACFPRNVSRSNDSLRFLLRLDHSVEVLSTRCEPIKIISRPHAITSVAWCDSMKFLTSERSSIYMISVDGHVHEKFSFPSLSLRAMAVVPTFSLLLVIGKVPRSPSERAPRDERTEKQLILFDLNEQKIRSRNPILDEIRHITVSSYRASEPTSIDVVLGHGRDNEAIPKIWTLELRLRDHHQLKQAKVQLQRPAGKVSGPGHLLGENELLVCVGTDGQIYIWKKSTGASIHQIKTHAIGNALRNVAWNPSSSSFACACDESFEIWTMDAPDVMRSHSGDE